MSTATPTVRIVGFQPVPQTDGWSFAIVKRSYTEMQHFTLPFIGWQVEEHTDDSGKARLELVPVGWLIHERRALTLEALREHLSKSPEWHSWVQLVPPGAEPDWKAMERLAQQEGTA